MKKIFYSLTVGLALGGLVLVGIFSGCTKVNDQFDQTKYDSLTTIRNNASYAYQLVDADYSTISKAALKVATNAKDSSIAKGIATNKYLSNLATSTVYMPFLLNTKYLYADLGSTANITYAFGQDLPAYMTDLTTSNAISTAEYKLVWADTVNYAKAFTPATLDKLPGILAGKFPQNTPDGTYKYIEYNYTATEPVFPIADVNYFTENFEAHTASTTSPYTSMGGGDGWLNTNVISGSTYKWMCRVYNGNKYTQMSSNGSGKVDESWLITKQIDLHGAIAPKFTFQLEIGYWTADCLTVWISEDFDGNEANIETATWVDLSSNFTFPHIPVTGYSPTMIDAGTADLTAYAGKKVYIAFKYNGDATAAASPKRTTTYEIDNIKVSDAPVYGKNYAVFKYNVNTWEPAEASFVALQPTDYTAMGVSALTPATALTYLPQFLNQKFPFAQAGDVKNVVYNTGATQFTLINGVWTSNSFKINKKEQFIFSNVGWVFDPTITIPLVKGNPNNDYVMVFINYLIAHKDDATSPTKWFPKLTYVNEEHYYGFSAFYPEIIMTGDRLLYGDDAIKALTTDDAKFALYRQRVAEAMPLFAQLNFPLLKSEVSGVQQYVIFTIPSYYSSSKSGLFTIKMKCTKSGSDVAPAEYEVVSCVETI